MISKIFDINLVIEILFLPTLLCNYSNYLKVLIYLNFQQILAQKYDKHEKKIKRKILKNFNINFMYCITNSIFINLPLKFQIEILEFSSL